MVEISVDRIKILHGRPGKPSGNEYKKESRPVFTAFHHLIPLHLFKRVYTGFIDYILDDKNPRKQVERVLQVFLLYLKNANVSDHDIHIFELCLNHFKTNMILLGEVDYHRVLNVVKSKFCWPLFNLLEGPKRRSDDPLGGFDDFTSLYHLRLDYKFLFTRLKKAYDFFKQYEVSDDIEYPLKGMMELNDALSKRAYLTQAPVSYRESQWEKVSGNKKVSENKLGFYHRRKSTGSESDLSPGQRKLLAKLRAMVARDQASRDQRKSLACLEAKWLDAAPDHRFNKSMSSRGGLSAMCIVK